MTIEIQLNTKDLELVHLILREFNDSGIDVIYTYEGDNIVLIFALGPDVSLKECLTLGRSLGVLETIGVKDKQLLLDFFNQ